MKILKKVLTIIIILILIIIIFLKIIYSKQTVSILGYHDFIKTDDRIKNNITDNLIMDIEKFEKQMKYLYEHNYKTLTLEEFYCFHQGKCKIPRKSVLITMDDGYQSNYDLAFPILKKYNLNAVVFYLGINEEGANPLYMTKKTIKRIKKEYPNIEVASHSYNLHIRGSINQDKQDIINDIELMKQVIDTQYYAYPFGAHNETMIKALQEKGYKMAFTFGPNQEHRKASKQDDIYKIPRLNISNDMPLWKFIIRINMPK